MLKKNDFVPFKLGTVYNPLPEVSKVMPKFKSITIVYPSRLNAMAIDPSKIAANENMQYTPGEIIFKVGIYKQVKVTLSENGGEIKISERSKRKSLIKHAALIMRQALDFDVGIEIDVENLQELRHVGLGSSSGLISSVAVCINELFGNPLAEDVLLSYLAQNHGEEIDGNSNMLMPVQCIGGSAAAGLYEGAMLILAGHSRVISSLVIDSTYKAIIGIPKDFQERDAEVLLKEEIRNFPKFIRSGKKYGPTIAYEILHKVLPAVTEGKFGPAGDLIYQYRFHMGSIKNCSYCYKKLPQIAKELSVLKTNGVAEVLSLSSVGPAFFAISTHVAECQLVFEKSGLAVTICDVVNEKYQVSNKE